MFNIYSITVGLFCLTGVVVAVWTGRNIIKKRKTTAWPSVTGRIVDVQKSSKENDSLPRVTFSYLVNNKDYQGHLDAPSGESSMPGYTDQFMKKYPVDRKIPVFYNPESPEIHVLKSGASREDWLIFTSGVSTFVIGLTFLVNNL